MALTPTPNTFTSTQNITISYDDVVSYSAKWSTHSWQLSQSFTNTATPFETINRQGYELSAYTLVLTVTQMP